MTMTHTITVQWSMLLKHTVITAVIYFNLMWATLHLCHTFNYIFFYWLGHYIFQSEIPCTAWAKTAQWVPPWLELNGVWGGGGALLWPTYCSMMGLLPDSVCSAFRGEATEQDTCNPLRKKQWTLHNVVQNNLAKRMFASTTKITCVNMHTVWTVQFIR